MKLSAAEADVELHPVARVFEQSFFVRYTYPVYFTRGICDQKSRVLAEVLKACDGAASRVCLVLDEGLLAHHVDLVAQLREKAARDGTWDLVGEPVVMMGGEACKNDPGQVEQLYKAFESLGLDRHSYVLVLGGGAVVDAAGFATATAHRGLRLVRAPTTVLGQNDSGVGVKNGVNRFFAKNFLGTFAPPWAVINDFGFLDTLRDRDFFAGMAEAIKVALIRDRSFFDWIEANTKALVRREQHATEQLIERTALLHLEHIRTGGDPFECGSSRPLDYGHWAAHKLETLTQNALRHGEAVAIGIALDTVYSAKRQRLAESEVERVLLVIEQLNLPIYDRALELVSAGGPAYLAGLEEFRQHLGGRLSVTLLDEIGRGVQVHEMDLELIESCRIELKTRKIG